MQQLVTSAGKISASEIWEKDKRKKDRGIKEGYTVIEIWESEINSNIKEKLRKLFKSK